MPDPTPNLPEGHRLVTLDAVDSTNAEAMRRALGGDPGPLWIMAGQQTAGRGRSGRSWASASGNLFTSLLVTLPSSAAPKAYQLSLVAGVAVVEAIDASGCLDAGTPLRLKWPNDILIGTEKAGGILVESSTGANGLSAVIGIGLNVVSHPGETTAPATHLGHFGTVPQQAFLLGKLASAVAGWLGRWHEGAGFADVRAAWLERAGPIGERCSVNSGQGRVEGRFAGLDADGALLILDAKGQTQRYTYGDVTLSP